MKIAWRRTTTLKKKRKKIQKHQAAFPAVLAHDAPPRLETLVLTPSNDSITCGGPKSPGIQREEDREAQPGRRRRPRVAGQVSWQLQNAPPLEEQVAATSLLRLALGSSAWRSTVRLPVGVGALMSAASSLEVSERRARPPLGEGVEGPSRWGGREPRGARRASKPGNAQSGGRREALIKRPTLRA